MLVVVSVRRVRVVLVPRRPVVVLVGLVVVVCRWVRWVVVPVVVRVVMMRSISVSTWSRPMRRSR